MTRTTEDTKIAYETTYPPIIINNGEVSVLPGSHFSDISVPFTVCFPLTLYYNVQELW